MSSILEYNYTTINQSKWVADGPMLDKTEYENTMYTAEAYKIFSVFFKAFYLGLTPLKYLSLRLGLSQILSQSHCSDYWLKSKLRLKYFKKKSNPGLMAGRIVWKRTSSWANLESNTHDTVVPLLKDTL